MKFFFVALLGLLITGCNTSPSDLDINSIILISVSILTVFFGGLRMCRVMRREAQEAVEAVVSALNGRTPDDIKIAVEEIGDVFDLLGQMMIDRGKTRIGKIFINCINNGRGDYQAEKLAKKLKK